MVGTDQSFVKAGYMPIFRKNLLSPDVNKSTTAECEYPVKLWIYKRSGYLHFCMIERSSATGP